MPGIVNGMDKRQQILEAAERVFRAKGLARATTREIAKDAGCAEGTLYVHFEDRLALFNAVLDECLPDVKEALYQLESLVGQRSVRENLESVALRLLTFYQRAQGIVCSIFAEPELLQAHRERLKEQCKGPQVSQALLADYISREQRMGRLNRHVSPEATASMILGACFHRVFVSLYMGIPVAQEPEIFVQEMINSLMQGMRKQSTVARQAKGANAFVEIGSLHP